MLVLVFKVRGPDVADVIALAETDERPSERAGCAWGHGGLAVGRSLYVHDPPKVSRYSSMPLSISRSRIVVTQR